MAEQFGASAPQELVLITKQLLYFERYAKALAPDYNMARDLYLVKNIFPEAVGGQGRRARRHLPRLTATLLVHLRSDYEP